MTERDGTQDLRQSGGPTYVLDKVAPQSSSSPSASRVKEDLIGGEGDSSSPPVSESNNPLLRCMFPVVTDEEDRQMATGCRSNKFYVLTVLSVANAISFCVRMLPSSMKDMMKDDLSLTDTETGLVYTAFLIAFVIFSPVFGTFVDKGMSRKWMIVIGIFIFSVGSCVTAFSESFWFLLLPRVFVGIGSAAFSAVAPSLLCDFFPPDRVSKAMSLFFAMIPVGTAFAFIIGGFLGDTIGWRVTFAGSAIFVAVIFAILPLKEPKKGRYDVTKNSPSPGILQGLKVLFTNPAYLFVVIGQTPLAGGLTAMADWLPAYFSRTYDMSATLAGLLVGGIVVVGAVAGTFLGAVLGDLSKRFTKQPYFFVSYMGLILATPLTIAILLMNIKYLACSLIFVSVSAVYIYVGPINAVLNNSVDANSRSRAMSLNLLIVNSCGSSYSSAVVGAISDSTGKLDMALLVVPIMFFLACVIWIVAWLVVKQSTAGEVASTVLGDPPLPSEGSVSPDVELDSNTL